MNPFAEHRRAFDAWERGDLRGAEASFARALEGFESLLTTPGCLDVIAARAARIPVHGARAADCAEQFRLALPRWLREFHFETASASLSRRELEAARSHWRLLARLATLLTAGAETDLDLLRQQLCERFEVTHEAASTTEEERWKTIDRAERLLALDPSNPFACDVTIQACAGAIHAYLDGGRQDGKDRRNKQKDERNTDSAKRGDARELTATLKRIMARKQRRRRGRMRRTVVCLRRRLRRAPHTGTPDANGMVNGYRALTSYYLSVGEIEAAIKSLRRARKIQPEDPEIRAWARRLRRLRNRG